MPSMMFIKIWLLDQAYRAATPFGLHLACGNPTCSESSRRRALWYDMMKQSGQVSTRLSTRRWKTFCVRANVVIIEQSSRAPVVN